MSAATDLELQSAREAVIEAHSAAESAHDLDAVIATFHRPRYEIVPTGEIFDGEDAVRHYHGENFAGIPDLTVEPIAAHHGEDAVAEEAWVSGTHLGTYHGLPPQVASFGSEYAASTCSNTTSSCASASTTTCSRSCEDSALHATRTPSGANSRRW